MQQSRQIPYVLKYLVGAVVFGCLPIALAVHQPVPLVYLMGLGLLTTGYMVLGWILQPLLARGTVGMTAAWATPVVVLAVVGLIAMEPLAVGPALVYFTSACARNQGISVRDFKPSNLREYGWLALATTPAVLLFTLVVYASDICQWAVWRMVVHEAAK